MAKSFEDLVLAKLDNLLRVLKQTAQIAVLNRVGFPPRDIADLLGTTGNTVNVALSNLRKGKEKKGKGRRSNKGS